MSSLPDNRVLTEIIEASLRNATRLSDDAEKLLTAGSAPTAHALAVLSLEETGKALLCRTVLQDPTAASAESFGKQFVSHQAKLGYVLSALALLATFADLVSSTLAGRPGREPLGDAEWKAFIRGQVTSRHARKMTGLYVDTDPTAGVVEPTVVTEEEATEAIQAAAMSQALVALLPLPSPTTS
ncbi:AbiV family abortive infection protein [Kribbella sp. NPDC056951]|uniref:AbiV family abortive infection protein n=1 Tax=Kribbella sp. NPDC056951 TaxID=3345978 RepID=UPI003629735E